MKVNIDRQELEQKKKELDLYQHIINKSMVYINDLIEEKQHKQNLVKELNQYVHGTITQIIDEESKFYEMETHDRLKVPPYSKVKRPPRDDESEVKLNDFVKRMSSQNVREPTRSQQHRSHEDIRLDTE